MDGRYKPCPSIPLLIFKKRKSFSLKLPQIDKNKKIEVLQASKSTIKT